jgi:hypothetical protein
MISIYNQPNYFTTSNDDFTEAHYRKLLRTAKVSYRFATYDTIPWNTRFILWRHDLDYSINRAAALATIEAEEDVTTTYFINPCSEYYNPFEPKQAILLRGILSCGHRLGLHFNAAFHEIKDEESLHQKVVQEARWIDEAFGVRPVAFSFHNPSEFHLQCDEERYGGLINCYSRRIKSEIPYCSDSNGYWRFRRLHDVLSDATDPCLQVLTHPGWWQEQPMPPRQRIFRCAFGRAKETMRVYDDGLKAHNRLNHAGFTDSLRFLSPLDSRAFALCDYLCNENHFDSLLAYLWWLHERQINQFCKAVFRKEWKVPASEINIFFEECRFDIDGWDLFKVVFGKTWQEIARVEDISCKELVDLRNSLIQGRLSKSKKQLEDGCIILCHAIESLTTWGKSQTFAYDGISHLDSIGIPVCLRPDGSLTDRLEEVAEEVSNFQKTRWKNFKADMQVISVDKACR